MQQGGHGNARIFVASLLDAGQENDVYSQKGYGQINQYFLRITFAKFPVENEEKYVGLNTSVFNRCRPNASPELKGQRNPPIIAHIVVWLYYCISAFKSLGDVVRPGQIVFLTISDSSRAMSNGLGPVNIISEACP